MDACEIANFLASELFMQQVDFFFTCRKIKQKYKHTHTRTKHLTESKLVCQQLATTISQSKQQK